MAEPSGEVQELIDAARYGDLEDVAVALDSKTPVNGTDELGRTGERFHNCEVVIVATLICAPTMFTWKRATSL